MYLSPRPLLSSLLPLLPLPPLYSMKNQRSVSVSGSQVSDTFLADAFGFILMFARFVAMFALCRRHPPPARLSSPLAALLARINVSV